jgi:CubicO group peptidase (beta-lactamase class C family)
MLALTATVCAPAWPADTQIQSAIEAVRPEAESYIAAGMQKLDLPGLAIGIVTRDELVYSKGFGVRRKSGGSAVDLHTVFQIGSATKGFLSATMALMVDRG